MATFDSPSGRRATRARKRGNGGASRLARRARRLAILRARGARVRRARCTACICRHSTIAHTCREAAQAGRQACRGARRCREVPTDAPRALVPAAEPAPGTWPPFSSDQPPYGSRCSVCGGSLFECETSWPRECGAAAARRSGRRSSYIRLTRWPSAPCADRAEFVRRWDEKVGVNHGAGRGNKKSAEGGSFSLEVAEEQTGISHQQVSDWRGGVKSNPGRCSISLLLPPSINADLRSLEHAPSQSPRSRSKGGDGGYRHNGERGFRCSDGAEELSAERGLISANGGVVARGAFAGFRSDRADAGEAGHLRCVPSSPAPVPVARRSLGSLGKPSLARRVSRQTTNHHRGHNGQGTDLDCNFGSARLHFRKQ